MRPRQPLRSRARLPATILINKNEAAAGVTISRRRPRREAAAVNGQTATITIVDGTNTIKDTYTATVTAGAWSVNVTALQAQALADGSYSIKASVSDAAGNAATTATQAIAVDETAPSGGTPVLTVASDSGTSHTDGITNVTAPTFTVALNSTVAAGDTVQLLLAGSALAHPVTHTVTAADVTAGSISLTVTAGDLGADGSKSITARFTDAAGNSSTTSALGLTLDTAAPAKPATAADAAVINGVVNAANDTASQALTGTAEGSSTVTVFDNGVQVGTALAAANGSWSYVIGVLANGSSHSYTVTATDAAGNTSAASDPLAFTRQHQRACGATGDYGGCRQFVGQQHDHHRLRYQRYTVRRPEIQVSSDGGSTWIDAVRNTGELELRRSALARCEFRLPGADHRHHRKLQCCRNPGCNCRQCRRNRFAGGFTPVHCGVYRDRRQSGAWIFCHHQHGETRSRSQTGRLASSAARA